jgi:hypothetical protein
VVSLGRTPTISSFLPRGGRTSPSSRQQCRVAVGRDIALDAATDAVETEIEGGELGVGLDDFPAAASRRRAGSRAAGCCAGGGAICGGNSRLAGGACSPQDVVQEAHRLDARGLGAAGTPRQLAVKTASRQGASTQRCASGARFRKLPDCIGRRPTIRGSSKRL